MTRQVLNRWSCVRFNSVEFWKMLTLDTNEITLFLVFFQIQTVQLINCVGIFFLFISIRVYTESSGPVNSLSYKLGGFVWFPWNLKGRYTIGSFQRPVSSLGVSHHICRNNKPVKIWAQSVIEVARKWCKKKHLC